MLYDLHDYTESGEFKDIYHKIDHIYANNDTIQLYLKSEPVTNLVSRIITNISLFSRLFASLLKLQKLLVLRGYMPITCMGCGKKMHSRRESAIYLNNFCAGCSFDLLNKVKRKKALEMFIKTLTKSLKSRGKYESVAIINNLYTSFKETSYLIDVMPTTILNSSSLV